MAYMEECRCSSRSLYYVDCLDHSIMQSVSKVHCTLYLILLLDTYNLIATLHIVPIIHQLLVHVRYMFMHSSATRHTLNMHDIFLWITLYTTIADSVCLCIFAFDGQCGVCGWTMVCVCWCLKFSFINYTSCVTFIPFSGINPTRLISKLIIKIILQQLLNIICYYLHIFIIPCG